MTRGTVYDNVMRDTVWSDETHHPTSHHITSHHITSPHITLHHIIITIREYITSLCSPLLSSPLLFSPLLSSPLLYSPLLFSSSPLFSFDTFKYSGKTLGWLQKDLRWRLRRHDAWLLRFWCLNQSTSTAVASTLPSQQPALLPQFSFTAM